MSQCLSLACFIACLTGPGVVAAAEVFFTDFDGGVPSEFDRPTTTTGVQGYAGLGDGDSVFGGEFLRDDVAGGVVTLQLDGLPPHDSLDLEFLLAIIDSWDGAGPSPGSDYLNVSVDGFVIFSESFENSGYSLPTYTPPTGCLLSADSNLGFTGGFPFDDAAYDMSLEPAFLGIPHSSDRVTIQWFSSGEGYQGGSDESWALDNVRVSVDGGVPVKTGSWGQVKRTF